MLCHLLVVLAIAGCYKQSRDPELVARIDTLEARIAEQDRQLATARTQSSSVELAALANQIAELTAKVAELEERVANGPAPRKRRGPDPDQLHVVPVGTSPVAGPSDAKVTMVFAFDFACRYCRRAWDTVNALRTKYRKDLRVVYKQYVVHPDTAMYPAQAACAASRQNKFVPFAQLVWTKGYDARKLDPSHIDKLAKEVKLDTKRYRADVESCLAEVKDDGTLMRTLSVIATPTFFINGRVLEGAKPQADFEAIIDEELAKSAGQVTP